MNIPENLATRSAIFVENLRRQTPLHRKKGEPLMFGLEPTEELVHVRLPLIKGNLHSDKKFTSNHTK